MSDVKTSFAGGNDVPLIRVEGVHKQYQNGAVSALNGVDLEIHKGDMVVVMGPSGSGKSTLLYMISTLDIPTSGSVYFDGKDISSMSDDEKSEIRSKIGFVFQDYNLIDALDATENVEIGVTARKRDDREKKFTGKSAKDRAVEMLRKVGLGDRATHTPDQMSGGEKQRVTIARAIAKDPFIIVADEPTGSLDSANGQQIMDMFKELNDKGFTVLIVTHSEAIARRYAKRLVNMKDGKIASIEVIKP